MNNPLSQKEISDRLISIYKSKSNSHKPPYNGIHNHDRLKLATNIDPLLTFSSKRLTTPPSKRNRRYTITNPQFACQNPLKI